MPPLALPICRFAPGLCLAAALLLLAGCGDGPDEPAAQTHRYTVRGIVQQVPAANEPGSSLMVKHEPIHNYKRRGEVVGMDSMVMPFPPAADLSLEGIKPGDKVRLTFEQTTGNGPSLETTAIEKLPPDTNLEFGKARPATQPTTDTHDHKQHED